MDKRDYEPCLQKQEDNWQNCDMDLHTAIRNNHQELLHFIFNNNPYMLELVNTPSANGDTPLLLALDKDSICLDIVRLLLDCGADVNKLNYDGYSSLHLYYMSTGECNLSKSFPLDELLLHYGADPNSQEPNCPVLHYLYNLHDQRMNVGKFQQVIQTLCNNWQAGFKFKNIPTDLLRWLGTYLFKVNYICLYAYTTDSNRLKCKKNEEIFNQHQSLIKLFHQDNLLWSQILRNGQLRIKLCGTVIPLEVDESDREFKREVIGELVKGTESPSSLQWCCAAVIRTSLKPNAITGVKVLKLPTQLTQYIVPHMS